jgi:hypothetical protein
MPQSLISIIVLLSWLALPVGLVCIVDDWFLRPRGGGGGKGGQNK